MTIKIAKSKKCKTVNEKDKYVLNLIFGKPKRSCRPSKAAWAFLLAFVLVLALIVAKFLLYPCTPVTLGEIVFLVFFFVATYLLTSWILEMPHEC